MKLASTFTVIVNISKNDLTVTIEFARVQIQVQFILDEICVLYGQYCAA